MKAAADRVRAAAGADGVLAAQYGGTAHVTLGWLSVPATPMQELWQLIKHELDSVP